MLVFGKAENINSNLVITGRVFDLGNQANPGVLAKRYVATLNEVSTREAAHRFADEIIKTLGGGLPGNQRNAHCLCQQAHGACRKSG